jgi:uncharacterized membrane protein
MDQSPLQLRRLLPASGCLGTALSLLILCLMPFILVDTMEAVLEKLHLNPQVAMWAVIGIFIGGLINIPIYRYPKEEGQLTEVMAVYGFWGLTPRLHRIRRDTIIAVNVGGCLIPLALAVWEISQVARFGDQALRALAVVVAVNSVACYAVARPVRGVGIVMPGLTSPLVAVGLTWLLLMPGEYDAIRAPVAFVGGVLGPLLGADLLHLKDIRRVSAGVLSIGGAGTFDGIVLSGVLAALLA